MIRGLSLPALANSPSVLERLLELLGPGHQDGGVIAGDIPELAGVADAENLRLQQVFERPVVVLQPELAQPEKRERGAVLRRQPHHPAERFGSLCEVVDRVVRRPLVPVALDVIGLDLDRLLVRRNRVFPPLRLPRLGTGLDEPIEFRAVGSRCAVFTGAGFFAAGAGAWGAVFPVTAEACAAPVRHRAAQRRQRRPSRSSKPENCERARSSAGPFGRRGTGPAASLLGLHLGVQPIDDHPLAIGIVFSLEPVVAGGELDVDFDRIRGVFRDPLEHGDRLLDLPGLQTEACQQLARGQIVRPDGRRALQVGRGLANRCAPFRMFPSCRLASKSLLFNPSSG